ncbi:hypothetical protein ACFQVC_01985 [Streptomyces monticola]|uniref:Uncharacterized protein n=1 Tax=Streptomyces monticola TaxID=2666263 RepID=A0ABW2JBR0_9ACTN
MDFLRPVSRGRRSPSGPSTPSLCQGWHAGEEISSTTLGAPVIPAGVLEPGPEPDKTPVRPEHLTGT